MYKSTCYDIVT